MNHWMKIWLDTYTQKMKNRLLFRFLIKNVTGITLFSCYLSIEGNQTMSARREKLLL